MSHYGTVKTQELTRKGFTRCRAAEAVEAKYPEKGNCQNSTEFAEEAKQRLRKGLSDAR